MNILLDVAQWIWGEDPEVTPEFCVDHLPLMNSSCWSRLAVKGIGVAIILGACLNKAPIILNLLSSKSAAGLSLVSAYGETLMYANSAFYGFLSGHPFTAYGETGALLIQTIVIALILWQLSAVSMKEKATVGLAASIYIFLVTTLLPADLYYLLITSVMPVMLYARGVQILETFRCKHTGAQSIVTVGMNVAGGLLRVFTTLKEVGWDIAFLANVGLSLGLNVVMLLQILYYQRNTEKFLADLKKAEAQKKTD